MKLLKGLLKSIGGLCIIIIIIIACIIAGWVIRYFVWIVCFIPDILYDWAIIDWIKNHDTATWVICSFSAPILFICSSLGGAVGGTAGNSSSGNFSFSSANSKYDDEPQIK